MERHLEHVCVEVDGVSGHVAVRPAPIRRLDEQPLVFQGFHVSGAAIPVGESAFFQQGRE